MPRNQTRWAGSSGLCCQTSHLPFPCFVGARHVSVPPGWKPKLLLPPKETPLPGDLLPFNTRKMDSNSSTCYGYNISSGLGTQHAMNSWPVSSARDPRPPTWQRQADLMTCFGHPSRPHTPAFTPPPKHPTAGRRPCPEQLLIADHKPIIHLDQEHDL